MFIRAETVENLCRLILMILASVVLPHIQVFLSHGKKNRNILLLHDMSLAETGIFNHTGNNLRKIMAEHMTDSFGRGY